MTIDPLWRFIIGLSVTLAIGVSTGTVVLTHAIPADWIQPAVAWCGIIAFVGSSAQTGMAGLAMTTQSRIASAAAIPQVHQIVTTDAVANGPQFAANDKVVSK